MLPINEAATALGLTRRQTYRRVSTMRPLLAPFIRKGEKGKLLLDSSAVEILRRAEALRREGLAVVDAVATIKEEINGNGESEQERPTGNEELVQALRERIAEQGKEIAWLRARIEELTPVALPRPRWWLRWPWSSFRRA